MPVGRLDSQAFPVYKIWGMWVSKPIYESLPYFYLMVGALCLGASMYVNHWYWPTICFATGLVCLVAGLVVLLKRRDYRMTERRTGH